MYHQNKTFIKQHVIKLITFVTFQQPQVALVQKNFGGRGQKKLRDSKFRRGLKKMPWVSRRGWHMPKKLARVGV